jgi:hypothetical protein
MVKMMPRAVIRVELELVDGDPVQLPDSKTALNEGEGDSAEGLAVLELLAPDPEPIGTAPQAANIKTASS